MFRDLECQRGRRASPFEDHGVADRRVPGRHHLHRDTSHEHVARTVAGAKAERWTDRQAWRLNTRPAVILEAIREHAWLPEQIEGVSSQYRLEDHPPLCTEIVEAIERIRRAPIVRDHKVKHAA